MSPLYVSASLLVAEEEEDEISLKPVSSRHKESVCLNFTGSDILRTPATFFSTFLPFSEVPANA